MQFEDLVKQFKAKKISGTYIFYGLEPFFIDYLADLLIQNALEDNERAFGQYIYYGNEADIESIKTTCRTVPMSFTANPKQLIVIKEAQSIGKKLDLIYSYLNNPVESTILLISFKETNTLDKKMPIKQATVFKSDVFDEKNMPKWITTQFKQEGYAINNDAINTIVEYCGTNMERIHNEIQKLIITKSKEIPITIQDIQQSFGILKDYGNFDLTNALGDRKFKTAMKIVDYYSRNEKKLSFESLLGILFSFYKTLYSVKLCIHLNMSIQDMATEFGSTAHRVNFIVKNASHYTILQLESAILILHEYDMRRKGIEGSTQTYSQLLQEMVLKLLA